MRDFLNKKHASMKNYIFATENKDAMSEALDPAWKGPLPYTIIVDEKGNVIYREMGVHRLPDDAPRHRPGAQSPDARGGACRRSSRKWGQTPFARKWGLTPFCCKKRRARSSSV